jgi:hypothetical protein
VRGIQAGAAGNNMEKAILKTLIYADLFNYPMLSQEIHKWLINQVATIDQVEKALKRAVDRKKIAKKSGMYFLNRRSALIQIRKDREQISQRYYYRSQWAANILKIIPWIQLVGISGSLAMRNADEKADIDFFIITRVRRIWLSRLLAIGLLELFGIRRSRDASLKESSGKICLNLFISEEVMHQPDHNLYVAHEVLQMKVLWQREKVYQRFLEMNQWVFNFLPNWIGMSAVERKISQGIKKQWLFFDWLEKIVEILQRRYMGRVLGQEKVGHQMAYFHPEDAGEWVMKQYQRRVAFLKGKA